jgi:hypothetical protein
MTATLHYECSLVQADGHRHLERGANNGDATDLYGGPDRAAFGSASAPASRWWDGTDSGLEISAIGQPGATVRFRVD